MARGISEQDVFEAADKLLARGERPTIERVRNELGRGSPNTVNRLLDGWWTTLSARHAAKEALKLPPQFQSACERLYEKVLADCRARAEEDFAARLATSALRRIEWTSPVKSMVRQTQTSAYRDARPLRHVKRAKRHLLKGVHSKHCWHVIVQAIEVLASTSL